MKKLNESTYCIVSDRAIINSAINALRGISMDTATIDKINRDLSATLKSLDSKIAKLMGEL